MSNMTVNQRAQFERVDLSVPTTGVHVRNRGAVIGLVVLGVLVFCAIFADVISPYDPSEQFRDAALRAPSLASLVAVRF